MSLARWTTFARGRSNSARKLALLTLAVLAAQMGIGEATVRSAHGAVGATAGFCTGLPNPQNSRPPHVTPTTGDVGTTLSVDNGRWSCWTVTGYAYKWYRGADAIAGANASTYTVGYGDAGYSVTAKVAARYIDDGGAAKTTSYVAADNTVAIPVHAPVATSRPVVSGTPQVGSTLAATTGSWQGSSSFSYSYQWKRCSIPGSCDALPGATSSTYVPTELDVGFGLLVEVTATNSAGAATALSDVTTPVIDAEAGTADSDVSAETGDDNSYAYADPQPVSPVGPVAPGSYTRDLWPGEATATPDGLYVVSSTASGTTALTGVVHDDETGDAISNATVTLSCQSGCSGAVNTLSDAMGSFSFINMPAGTYNLAVAGSGYGSYEVRNDAFAGDTPYMTTVGLNDSPQVYEMGGADADSTAAPDPTLAGTAYSQRRVPPTIRVRMLNTHPRSAGSLFCTTSGGPTEPAVRTYPWSFYILHTVFPEVGGLGYNQTAMKAFMSIVQNFAWFHKTKPGDYDVTNAANTYAGQCFRPEEKVNIPIWSTWLQDVLDERIADADGNLHQTQYASGTTDACTDPVFPANGTRASQRGIKRHSQSDSGCYIAGWRDLAVYYYPASWRVTAGLAPPVPVTSWSAAGGQLTLTFNSRVYGKNVAWRYYLQRLTSTGWRTFRIVGWNQRIRGIVTSHTFAPTGCMRYRVKAVNPVNDTAAAIAETKAAAFTPAGVGLNTGGTCQL